MKDDNISAEEFMKICEAETAEEVRAAFDAAVDKRVDLWREKADAIFDAFLDCIWRNYEGNEAQREGARKYLLHKMVWDMTGSNRVAYDVLRLVAPDDFTPEREADIKDVE